MALPSKKLITINDRGARSATTFGSLTSGGANMVFIKKLTASSSSTLSFVDGTDGVVLDDTYKEYLFTFKNIHPSVDDREFEFNLSIDGGSNYNVTKTTTRFSAYHGEDGGLGVLENTAGEDLAQSTAFQGFQDNYGGGADECGAGQFTLFNPSSTTFVKHFISRTTNYHSSSLAIDCYLAGYANTTSAVDAIRFQFTEGTIEAGDICLYGIL